MQTQNQHLLQQLTERDEYNIQLVSESVKAKQSESLLLSEKQELSKQFEQLNGSLEVLKSRIAQSEEQMKHHHQEVLSSIQEDRHMAMNLEAAKWELADAEKELKMLKFTVSLSEREHEQIQRISRCREGTEDAAPGGGFGLVNTFSVDFGSGAAALHEIGAEWLTIPVKEPQQTGLFTFCNLTFGTDENMLAEHFGTIGLLKKDKRTGRPKIWLYRDKVTNEPKGDATVTYEDPHAALAAVEWFNNKDFHGATIGVFMAESKNKDDVANLAVEQVIDDAIEVEDPEGASDVNGGGRGRGRGDAAGKPWQQDGDWLCTNTSCSNVNFAFRGVCNRCGTARPAGASVGGSAGGGRGRGRGANDSGGTRAVGATGGGLFGPNDWPYPMCGNINWAKRTKCNICNTNKPGTSEGGVRGGCGGGYKELDEEELEETKRRRREAEEDDGEMYDEFGNLKKKFRAKTHQGETTQGVPGVGRAGWEVEEIGDKDNKRERSKDKGRERDERGTGIEVEITIDPEREIEVTSMIATENTSANVIGTAAGIAVDDVSGGGLAPMVEYLLHFLIL